MTLTAFAEEKLLLQLPNGEALLVAKMRNGWGYVAVAKDGFRTDYPLLVNNGLLWEHPELFTEGFRRRCKTYIRRNQLPA